MGAFQHGVVEVDRSAHDRGDELGLVVDQSAHVDPVEVMLEHFRVEHPVIEVRDDSADARESAQTFECGGCHRSFGSVWSLQWIIAHLPP